jgi:TPP-dependent pyruvate/acetoin dehydrogenase alpha subunit
VTNYNKKNFLLDVFKKASLCRHFENEVYKRVANREIEFPVYLSAGQEYAPATIAEIVKQKKIKPLIFGQHRGHSIFLSFGGNIKKLIKELKGKKDGCTYGMGGSLSIHSPQINMYGHDGFMGSNACIGTGACFSSKRPTIIFIGDAALEEDYVLASLSWVSKKRLPILFVVDDNNYAVLTKKDERRDWSAKELGKALKIESHDIKDDPKKIFKSISKNLFKKPILVNIHTNRIFWHAGAGKDEGNVFDRYLQQKKYLGKKANIIDNEIKRKIGILWAKN